LLLGFASDGGGRRSLADVDEATAEWRVDATAQRTREDVAVDVAGEWRRLPENGVIAWTSPAVAWVRVTLRNPGAEDVRGVLADDDYFLDRVEAWRLAGGEWRHARSGEAVPAAEKPIAGRDAAFPVTVPAGGETVVYLRAEDRLTGLLRLSWWPDQGVFQAVQARRGLAEGVYLGVLFALLGYNALLWLRLRIADIGCYVLYLGAGAVFILLARAQVAVLGGTLPSPWLELALVIAIAASVVFLTQFARVFLDLAVSPSPWPHRITRGLQVAVLLVAAGALTTPWMHDQVWLALAVGAAGVTHATLCVLAIAAWRRGVRTARFFIAAFGCLFAGTLPMVAVWWWGDAFKDIAMQGLMIGSALEMLLLSFATADRFAQAQRRIIEETEHRRTMEEAYADELETEVRERTRELEEANADKDRMLAVIGHDLRGPLTGLMKSADRPTAEFVRETAGTGRALLLMIEDLVLWARMRAGTREIAAHPARALLQPAVALHRALAVSGGTELVIDVPDNLRVGTDLVLAQTLVRNLLANALKFARTRVVLRAEGGADGVCFSVSNDGEPLRAEIVARLVSGQNEPMTATGGLGLRLCREICAALGMKLEARAPAGGGAEFAFTLPAADDSTEEQS
jgi:signal transduction histidine kinase